MQVSKFIWDVGIIKLHVNIDMLHIDISKWHVDILVIMLNAEIDKSHVNITYVRFKMVVMRSPLLKYMYFDTQDDMI